MGRIREHRAKPNDAYRLTVEHSREAVFLGAGEQIGGVDEREPPEVAAAPRRRELSRIEPVVCHWGQTLAPDAVGLLEDGAKEGTLGQYKICHRRGRLYGSFLNLGPPAAV